MNKIKTVLFCVWLILSAHLNAQEINQKEDLLVTYNDSVQDLIDSLKEITPCIEIGGDYMNHVVFWGRDFGVNQFGIEPCVMYKNGKGLYMYITEHYWDGMPNKLGKTDIGIGYEKQFTDKFYASLGYERWIFFNGNQDVRKALTNCLEADFNYDFKFISLEPTIYYMFGTDNFFQTDLTLHGSYYLFSFLKTGEFYLKPQFVTTLANQTFLPLYSNYPSNYIKNNNFKVIDFDINLPIAFKIKNFELAPTLHYNIPLKAPNESISNFFYFSLNFTYNIYRDNNRIKSLYKLLKK